MLAKLPADLKNLSGDQLDQEILRLGIIAELDAVNLYQQMATMASDPHLKTVLADIAKEEKEHVGEFQALLLKADVQQKEALEEGAKEVEELTNN